MKKKYINEIYVTRTLAILGVLIVHATSFPVSELATSSSLYSSYDFLNTFFRFGTPTFIFLSSFVLFYSYYDRPLTKELIGRFYKKRLLYIIIPYVIFSVIYYLYNYPYYASIMTNSEMALDFLAQLATGNAASHLYFVFISIQFYLLFPLLLYLFKRFKKLVTYAFWIGLILQWLFVLVNQFYLQVPNKGSIALSYMSYYFLGIYVGINYDKIVSYLTVKKSQLFSDRYGLITLLTWISWLGFAISHAFIWIWSRTTGNWAHSLVYEFLWNGHTLLSALVVLQASYVIYHKFPRKIVNPMIHLGIMSFGVYLIHLLVLNLYQRYLPDFGNSILYHSKSVGGFIVTLIVSWVIVTFVVKRFPNSWILFGSTPKKIPYIEEDATKKSTTKFDEKLS